jgi:CRISPR type IV-associated protein Csf1
MVASASDLYCLAAGLEPETSCLVTEPSHCRMCAAHLAAGDSANLVTKNTFDDAFNNKLDLRALTGKYVCGACQRLWEKDWLQKYSKTFACKDGVFKLASNDQCAAFLLNPPEPPFAAIFSTKQQQHMIWRTPLSLSRALFVVRVDKDLLQIRHQVLIDAWRAFRHAESVMATIKPTGRATLLKPPAALFSRELATGKMGMLREDVCALLRQTGDTWVIDQLHRLSIGEWWALGIIRHYDPESPPPYVNAMAA